MPYGAGRNTEFAAQAASQSPLAAMQERYQRLAASAGYQPRSVLDSPARSGIGLAEGDRSRQLINGEMMPSRNGSSESTYAKRQALGLETNSMYRSL